MSNTIIVRAYDFEKNTGEVLVRIKSGERTTIQAEDRINYEFFDERINAGPNHIITKREGNDLLVSFEEEGVISELLIENFYENDLHALIGIAEDGNYYYYIPDTGEIEDYVTELATNDVEGAALGGEPLVVPFWIPLNVAGFPWWGLAIPLIPFVIRDKDDEPVTSPPDSQGEDAFGYGVIRDGFVVKPVNPANADTMEVSYTRADGIKRSFTIKKVNGTWELVTDGGFDIDGDGQDDIEWQDKDNGVVVFKNIYVYLQDENGNKTNKLNLEKSLHPDEKVVSKTWNNGISGGEDADTIPKNPTVTVHETTKNPDDTISKDGHVEVNPVDEKIAKSMVTTFTDANGNKQTIVTVKNPVTGEWEFVPQNGNDKTTVATNGSNGIKIDPKTGIVTIPSILIKPHTDVTVINKDISGKPSKDDIGQVNADPIAENDLKTILEDTSTTGNLIDNDNDRDNNKEDLKIKSFTVNGKDYLPSDKPVEITDEKGNKIGDLTIKEDGIYTFTPVNNWTGNVPVVKYELIDGHGGSDDATLNITVTPVNDPPVAVTDKVTTPFNKPVTVDVTTNDKDPDGVDDLDKTSVKLVDPKTGTPVEKVDVPNEGTWTVDNTGKVTFTPVKDFSGTVTPIKYTIKDKNGVPSNPAEITVTVGKEGNNPPEPKDNIVTVAEDKPLTGNVVKDNDPVHGQDKDPDGSALTVTKVTIDNVDYPADGKVIPIKDKDNQPVGDLTVQPDGSYTFTPVKDWNGTVPPITYTVTDGELTNNATLKITVTPASEPPIATPDEATTPFNTPVRIPVTENDKDPDSPIDNSSIKLIDPRNPSAPPTEKVDVPNEGTWTVDKTTGHVIFTPVKDFTGKVTPISYTITDKDGNTSNKTPISVTVGKNGNTPPVAEDNQRTITEDSPEVKGNVIKTPDSVSGLKDNDKETPIDDLKVTKVTINGVDYPVTGNTTVPVTDGQNKPVGTLTIQPNGDYTFKPVPDFNGQVPPITYTITDGELTDNANLKITVTPVNDPPIADDNRITVKGGEKEPLGLLDPIDPDTPLKDISIKVTKLPEVGTLTKADGTPVKVGDSLTNDELKGLVYEAPKDYTGKTNPTFEYNVFDKDGGADVGTVEIRIVNPPVAGDDVIVVNTPPTADNPVRVPVLTNDNDPDGKDNIDPNSVLLNNPKDPSAPPSKTVDVPGEGTWTVTPTGDVTFTPNTDFKGNPTPITYTVKDKDGNPSNPAKITITVNNQPPVATPDTGTVHPNKPVTIDVVGNDNDPEDKTPDPSTVLLKNPKDPSAPPSKEVKVPGEGTWTVDNTGKVTFTPDPKLDKDPTPITYTVKDKDGNISNEAPVTLTFNKPPVATDDSTTTKPNQPVTVSVVGNDNDPEDGKPDPTTVLLNNPKDPSAPPSKEVKVPGEGTWTVTPTGDVTFTPNTDFRGNPTPITYTVKDKDGNPSNPAKITITVEQVPPVAVPDTGTVHPNKPVTIDIVGNDNDPDGEPDPSTVLLKNPKDPSAPPSKEVKVPDEGTWTVDNTGKVTFTPDPKLDKDPTPITYTVKDKDGNTSNEATVTLTFNKPPVATDDTGKIKNPNEPVTIDVVGNDTDPEDGRPDPTTVQLIDPKDNQPKDKVETPDGTWTVDKTTGKVTFTPVPDLEKAPDPITYTVKDKDGNTSNPAKITLTYNDPPVAENDTGVINNPKDGEVKIPVIRNDNDPDGIVDHKTVDLYHPDDKEHKTPLKEVTTPDGTWIVDKTTGEVIFKPIPDLKKDPTPIDYTVKDNDGNTSNPATITLTLNKPPVTTDDSKITNPGKPVTINVLENDSDPEKNPDESSVLLRNPKDPSAPPSKTVDVPGEGTWTVDDKGNVTFTPVPTFTGNPTPVTYTFKDKEGNESNPSTITITVTNGPIAEDDSASTKPKTPVVIDVLKQNQPDGTVGKDTDPDDKPGVSDLKPETVKLIDPVTKEKVTEVKVPNEGTWKVNPEGTVTFTPDDQLDKNPTPVEYTVEDSTGNETNPAKITVTLDLPPVAKDDVEKGEPTKPVVVDVLKPNNPDGTEGKDTDPNNDIDPTTVKLYHPDDKNHETPLTRVPVDGEGVWTVNPTTGVVTFTPEEGFTGSPTPIDYTVSDKPVDGSTPNTSNPAKIHVTVPVDDVGSGEPNKPVTVPVTSNDGNVDPTTVKITDPNGNPVTELKVPNEGTWTVDPKTGDITFTPDGLPDGKNPTPITYTVTTKDGKPVDPAKVTVEYGLVARITAPDDTATEGVDDTIVFQVNTNKPVEENTAIKVVVDSTTVLKPEDVNTITYVDGSGKVQTLRTPEEIKDFFDNGVTVQVPKGSNQPSEPITFGIKDDAIYEPVGEKITLKVLPEDKVYTTVAGEDTATATVYDEDQKDNKDNPRNPDDPTDNHDGDKPISVVSITSPDNVAVEGVDPVITFVVNSKEPTLDNVPVHVKVDPNSKVKPEDVAEIRYIDGNGTVKELTTPEEIKDFFDNGTSVLIPSGESASTPITIQVKDDKIYEKSEPITLTITEGGYEVETGKESATATVNDEDQKDNQPDNPRNPDDPNDPVDGDKPTAIVNIKSPDNKAVEGVDDTITFQLTSVDENGQPKPADFDTPVTVKVGKLTDPADKPVSPADFEEITYINGSGAVTTLTTPAEIKDFLDNGATVLIPAGKDTSDVIKFKVKDDSAYEIVEKIVLEVVEGDGYAVGNEPSASATVEDENQGTPTDPVNNTGDNPNNKDNPNDPNDGDKPVATVKITSDDNHAVEGKPDNNTFSFKVETNDGSPVIEDVKVNVKLDQDTTSNLRPEDVTNITYTNGDGAVVELREPKDIEKFFEDGATVLIPKDGSASQPIVFTVKDDTTYERTETVTARITDPTESSYTVEPGKESATATVDDEDQKDNVPDNPKNPDNPNDDKDGDRPAQEVGIYAVDAVAVEGVDPEVSFKVQADAVSDVNTVVNFTISPDSAVKPEDITKISYIDGTGKVQNLTDPKDIADFFTPGKVLTTIIPAGQTESSPITFTAYDDEIYERTETLKLQLEDGFYKVDTLHQDAEAVINDEDNPNNPEDPNNTDKLDGDKPVWTVGIEATDPVSVEGVDSEIKFRVVGKNNTPAPEDKAVVVKFANTEIEPEDIREIRYTDGNGGVVSLTDPAKIKEFIEGGSITVQVKKGESASPEITFFTVDDKFYEKTEKFTLTIGEGAYAIDSEKRNAEARIDDEDQGKPTDPVNNTGDNPNNPDDPNDPTDGDKPTATVNINAVDNKAIEGVDDTFTFVVSTEKPADFDTPVKVKPVNALGDVNPADISEITYESPTGMVTLRTPEEIKDFFDNGVEVVVRKGESASQPITFKVVDDSDYEVSEKITLEIQPGGYEIGSKRRDDAIVNDEDDRTPDDKQGDKPTETVKITTTDPLAVEGDTSNPTIAFTVGTEKDTPVVVDTRVNVKVVPTSENPESNLSPEDISIITYTDGTGSPVTLSTPEEIKKFFDEGATVLIKAGESASTPIVMTAVDDTKYEKSETVIVKVADPTANSDKYAISTTADTAKANVNDEDQKNNIPDNPKNPDDPTDPTDGDRPAQTVGIYTENADAVEGDTNNQTVSFFIKTDKVLDTDNSIKFAIDGGSTVDANDFVKISYTDGNGTIRELTSEADIKAFFESNDLSVLLPKNSEKSGEIVFTAKDDDAYERVQKLTLNLVEGTYDIDPAHKSADALIYDEDGTPTTPDNDNEGDRPDMLVGIEATDKEATEGMPDNAIVFKVTSDKPALENTSVNFVTKGSKVTADDIQEIRYTDGNGTARVLTTPEEIKAFFEGASVQIPAGSDTSSDIVLIAKDDTVYERQEELVLTLTDPTSGGKYGVDPNKRFDNATINDEDQKDNVPDNPNNPDNPDDKYDGDKPPFKANITALDGVSVEGVDDTLTFQVTTNNEKGEPEIMLKDTGIKVKVNTTDSSVHLTENDFNEITYIGVNGGVVTLNTPEQIKDFLENGATVQVAKGESASQPITFKVKDDVLYEVTEKIVLEVSNEDGGYEVGINSKAEGLIHDENQTDNTGDNPNNPDDPTDDKDGDKPTAVVSIHTTKPDAIEGIDGNNKVSFEVVGIRNTASVTATGGYKVEPLSVSIKVDESSAVKPADVQSITYTNGQGTKVTIVNPADIEAFFKGTTVQVPDNHDVSDPIIIEAKDDTLYERTESIKLVIVDPTEGAGYTVDSSKREASANIHDEDQGKEGFPPNNYDDNPKNEDNPNDDKDGDRPVPTIGIHVADNNAVEGVVDNSTVTFYVESNMPVDINKEVNFQVDKVKTALSPEDVTQINFVNGKGTPIILTLAKDILDFFNNPQHLFIEQGKTVSEPIVFTVKDDENYEKAEKITLELLEGAYYKDEDHLNAEATVYDEDGTTPGDHEGDKPSITVGIETVDGSAVEGEDHTVSFVIKSDINSPDDKPVRIVVEKHPSASGIKDVEPSDFTRIEYVDGNGTKIVLTTPQEIEDFFNPLIGATVLIPKDKNISDVITFTAKDDDLYEKSETLTLKIVDGGYAVDPNKRTADAIVDDEDSTPTTPDNDKEGDKPTVTAGIVTVEPIAIEGSASKPAMTFKIELDQNASENVAVNIEVVKERDFRVSPEDIAKIEYTDGNGSIITLDDPAEIADFFNNGANVLVEKGSNQSTEIKFTIVDDVEYENIEAIKLGIKEGAYFIDNNKKTATAEIHDEDQKDNVPDNPNNPDDPNDERDGDIPALTVQIGIHEGNETAVEGDANNSTIAFEVFADKEARADTAVKVTVMKPVGTNSGVNPADVTEISYTDGVTGTVVRLTTQEEITKFFEEGAFVLIPENAEKSTPITFTFANDDLYEVREPLTLKLGVGAYGLGLKQEATGTVFDEDGPVPGDHQGDKPQMKVHIEALKDNTGATINAVEKDPVKNYVGFTIFSDKPAIEDSSIAVKVEPPSTVSEADIQRIEFTDGTGNKKVIDRSTDPEGIKNFFANGDTVFIPKDGTQSDPIKFFIVDDKIYEKSEPLVLAISTTVGSSTYEIDGLRNRDTAHIFDEDGPVPGDHEGDRPKATVQIETVDGLAVEDTPDNQLVFKISTENNAAAEIDTVVQFSVDNSKVSPEDIAKIEFVDGNGTAQVLDEPAEIKAFFDNPQTVLIPKDQSEAPVITFTIKDDDDYERSEPLTLSINTKFGGYETVVGKESASGVIEDEDSTPTTPDNDKEGDKPEAIVEIFTENNVAVEGVDNLISFFVKATQPVQGNDPISVNVKVADPTKVNAKDFSEITYIDGKGAQVVLNTEEQINDFLTNGATVQIKNGEQQSAEIVFTVVDDKDYEREEPISLQVENGNGYTTGTAIKATAKVLDEDQKDNVPDNPNNPDNPNDDQDGDKPVLVVSIETKKPVAEEGKPDDYVGFVVKGQHEANGSPVEKDTEIKVVFDPDKSATGFNPEDVEKVEIVDANGAVIKTVPVAEFFGTDGFTVTIPEGQREAPEIRVYPKDDKADERSEVVGVKLGEGDYHIDPAKKDAQATINDHDNPATPEPNDGDKSDLVVGIVTTKPEGVEKDDDSDTVKFQFEVVDNNPTSGASKEFPIKAKVDLVSSKVTADDIVKVELVDKTSGAVIATLPVDEVFATDGFTVPAHNTENAELVFTIKDDTHYEKSEPVTLVVLENTTVGYGIDGNKSSASATINDEDGANPGDKEGDKPLVEVGIEAVKPEAVEKPTNDDYVSFKVVGNQKADPTQGMPIDTPVTIEVDTSTVSKDDVAKITIMENGVEKEIPVEDFFTNGYTVTIPANGKEAPEIKFFAKDDTKYENLETLTLKVKDGGYDKIVGKESASGTISDEDITDPNNPNNDPNDPRDGDKKFVGIVGPDKVSEKVGEVTYIVYLEGGQLAETDTIVGWAIENNPDGSAKNPTENNDFGSALTGTVTIPQGSNKAEIKVTITDDTQFENIEDYIVKLTDVNGTGVFKGTKDKVETAIYDNGETITVKTPDPNNPENPPTDTPVTADDDRPKMKINDVTVTEGRDTFAEFTLNLVQGDDITPAPSDKPLMVSITTANGNKAGNATPENTAEKGQDYEERYQIQINGNWEDVADPSNVEIPAGATSFPIRVLVNSDTVAEQDEKFTITVTAKEPAMVKEPSTTGEGTILDNPGYTVGVTGQTEVNEAVGTVKYKVSLDRPNTSGEAITVKYKVVHGNKNDASEKATDDNDGNIVQEGTITFAPNAQVDYINVGINDDKVYEGTEKYTVIIENPSSPVTSTSIRPNEDHVVTAVKDDGTGTTNGNPPSDPPVDNPPPATDDRLTITVSDASTVELNETGIVFDITLSQNGTAPAEPVKLNLNFTDGTAKQGEDFKLEDVAATTVGKEDQKYEYSTDGGNTWLPVPMGNVITTNAGVGAVKVRVPVVRDDSKYDAVENFTLKVDAATVSTTPTTASATGTGTIYDVEIKAGGQRVFEVYSHTRPGDPTQITPITVKKPANFTLEIQNMETGETKALSPNTPITFESRTFAYADDPDASKKDKMTFTFNETDGLITPAFVEGGYNRDHIANPNPAIRYKVIVKDETGKVVELNEADTTYRVNIDDLHPTAVNDTDSGKRTEIIEGNVLSGVGKDGNPEGNDLLKADENHVAFPRDTDTADTKLSDLKVMGVEAYDSTVNPGRPAPVDTGLGSQVQGKYGTLVLNADGSYKYTPDTANPAVQALVSETQPGLVDEFYYTLGDRDDLVGDGTRSRAKLTITVKGTSSGDPSIDIPDDGSSELNPNGVGHKTVFEGDGAQTGTFSVKAPDGLTSLKIAGVEWKETDATKSHTFPENEKGQLTITGFTKSGDTYTFNYSYDPKVQTHNNTVNDGKVNLDTYKLELTSGTKSVEKDFEVAITDSVPVAVNDTNEIKENTISVTGHVINGTGATNAGKDNPGTNDGLDKPITLDTTATTAIDENGDAKQTTLDGEGYLESANGYGKVKINADGSYTYVLNNENETVNNLENGQTLTDVYRYKIKDADGDESEALLTITINGTTDKMSIRAEPPSNVSEEGFESAITGGTQDGVAADNHKDTTNLLTGEGAIIVEGVESVAGMTINLERPTTNNITSEGARVVWEPNGTTGWTGYRTKGGVKEAVLTLTMDPNQTAVDKGNGNWEYKYNVELHKPVDHPLDEVGTKGEDTISITSKVSLKSGTQTILHTTGTVTIVEDDSPQAQNSKHVIEVPVETVRLGNLKAGFANTIFLIETQNGHTSDYTNWHLASSGKIVNLRNQEISLTNTSKIDIYRDAFRNLYLNQRTGNLVHTIEAEGKDGDDYGEKIYWAKPASGSTIPATMNPTAKPSGYITSEKAEYRTNTGAVISKNSKVTIGEFSHDNFTTLGGMGLKETDYKVDFSLNIGATSTNINETFKISQYDTMNNIGYRDTTTNAVRDAIYAESDFVMIKESTKIFTVGGKRYELTLEINNKETEAALTDLINRFTAKSNANFEFKSFTDRYVALLTEYRELVKQQDAFKLANGNKIDENIQTQIDNFPRKLSDLNIEYLKVEQSMRHSSSGFNVGASDSTGIVSYSGTGPRPTHEELIAKKLYDPLLDTPNLFVFASPENLKNDYDVKVFLRPIDEDINLEQKVTIANKVVFGGDALPIEQIEVAWSKTNIHASIDSKVVVNPVDAEGNVTIDTPYGTFKGHRDGKYTFHGVPKLKEALADGTTANDNLTFKYSYTDRDGDIAEGLVEFDFSEVNIDTGKTFNKTATDDTHYYVVGSAGADTINTGKGFDVVVALTGNDTINTGEGADIIYYAGSGATIDAGSSSEKKIDENGKAVEEQHIDVLYMNGYIQEEINGKENVGTINFATLESKIKNIEMIDLTDPENYKQYFTKSEQTLDMTSVGNGYLNNASNDFINNPDKRLLIKGDDSDKVKLSRDYTKQGTDVTTIDGVEYYTYKADANSPTLLIDKDMGVIY